jgi:hypothetical protein
MKFSFIKLGSRISNTGTAASARESLALASLLGSEGATVDCYTKILKNENLNPFKNVYMRQIEDVYEEAYKGYDALIVVSGNVNFFGGAERRDWILNYYIINNFEGPVFYVLVDVNLFLSQIWSSVKKKEWGNKYSKEDIEITRNDIIYISQPYDVNAVWNKIKKEDISIKKVVHFPIQKWALTKDRLMYTNNKKIDLQYGGAFRPSRQKKLIKYYFGYDDFDVELFGNISLDKFNKKYYNGLTPPRFTKAVKFKEFMNKMNQSKATIIVGDKWYEGKNITLRVYESILANNITFIDSDFDPYKKIYSNKNLKNFLYVKNRREVKDKLNNCNHKEICNMQYKDVISNFENFNKDFYTIIKENI